MPTKILRDVLQRVTEYLAARRENHPNRPDQICGYNGDTPLLASDLDIMTVALATADQVAPAPTLTCDQCSAIGQSYGVSPECVEMIVRAALGATTPGVSPSPTAIARMGAKARSSDLPPSAMPLCGECRHRVSECACSQTTDGPGQPDAEPDATKGST